VRLAFQRIVCALALLATHHVLTQLEHQAVAALATADARADAAARRATEAQAAHKAWTTVRDRYRPEAR